MQNNIYMNYNIRIYYPIPAARLLSCRQKTWMNVLASRSYSCIPVIVHIPTEVRRLERYHKN